MSEDQDREFDELLKWQKENRITLMKRNPATGQPDPSPFLKMIEEIHVLEDQGILTETAITMVIAKYRLREPM